VLLEVLSSSSPELEFIISAMRGLGTAAKPLIPRLINIAQRGDYSCRELVFTTLDSIDASLRQTTPEMEKTLNNIERRKRWQNGEFTVGELIEGLKEPALIRQSLTCLQQLGPQAADAVPQLLAAVEDQHGDCRNNVVATLHQIDPQLSLPVVGRDTIYTNFQAAALNLGLGPDAHKFTELLFLARPAIVEKEWLTHREVIDFTHRLATTDPEVHQAFLSRIAEKNPDLLRLLNGVQSQPGQ
jgi:hypothetical protein